MPRNNAAGPETTGLILFCLIFDLNVSGHLKGVEFLAGRFEFSFILVGILCAEHVRVCARSEFLKVLLAERESLCLEERDPFVDFGGIHVFRSCFRMQQRQLYLWYSQGGSFRFYALLQQRNYPY